MPRGVPFGELWGEGPKFWGSADPANVELRERERAQAERELDERVDVLGLRTAVDDFAEFGYCIVHDAIPPELCDAACELMMAGAASGLERSRGVIGQEGDL
ncbi:MAG: hypothetical protein KYX65_07630, partial [Tabrizicola sp.]|nr:hypothetical protein [Tabrizicola sp.]